MKRSIASTGGNGRDGERQGDDPASVGGLLREADRRLHLRYGTEPLGNLPDPLDELIFIQLTIRTREQAYRDVFDQLQTLVDGDWARLLALDDESVLSVLEAGGMASVKLQRLRGQLRAIIQQFGEASLAPLHDMRNAEAEDFLLSLPGVGPKAARCVLLYSLGRQVFPVDSHCLRIMRRLQLISPDIHRKAAHDAVQELVPTAIRRSLHINMIHHGRDLCRPGEPECAPCPLLALCPTGQEMEGREP